MQMNPGATSAQVKEWLKNRGTKLTDKYQDEYTDDTQTTYWTGAYNMRGAEKRLLHDETANDAVPSIVTWISLVYQSSKPKYIKNLKWQIKVLA